MFDIGFLELLVIGVLGLLILGPERLPGAIRTTTLWINRLRRSVQQVKMDLEREVDVSDLKQQIHNEAILERLKNAESDIEAHIQNARTTLQQELGDGTYDISGIPGDNDTLPDHDPIPYSDEEPEHESGGTTPETTSDTLEEGKRSSSDPS